MATEARFRRWRKRRSRLERHENYADVQEQEISFVADLNEIDNVVGMTNSQFDFGNFVPEEEGNSMELLLSRISLDHTSEQIHEMSLDEYQHNQNNESVGTFTDDPDDENVLEISGVSETLREFQVVPDSETAEDKLDPASSDEEDESSHGTVQETRKPFQLKRQDTVRKKKHMGWFSKHSPRKKKTSDRIETEKRSIENPRKKAKNPFTLMRRTPKKKETPNVTKSSSTPGKRRYHIDRNRVRKVFSFRKPANLPLSPETKDIIEEDEFVAPRRSGILESLRIRSLSKKSKQKSPSRFLTKNYSSLQNETSLEDVHRLETTNPVSDYPAPRVQPSVSEDTLDRLNTLSQQTSYTVATVAMNSKASFANNNHNEEGLGTVVPSVLENLANQTSIQVESSATHEKRMDEGKTGLTQGAMQRKFGLLTKLSLTSREYGSKIKFNRGSSEKKDKASQQISSCSCSESANKKEANLMPCKYEAAQKATTSSETNKHAPIGETLLPLKGSAFPSLVPFRGQQWQETTDGDKSGEHLGIPPQELPNVSPVKNHANETKLEFVETPMNRRVSSQVSGMKTVKSCEDILADLSSVACSPPQVDAQTSPKLAVNSILLEHSPDQQATKDDSLSEKSLEDSLLDTDSEKGEEFAVYSPPKVRPAISEISFPTKPESPTPLADDLTAWTMGVEGGEPCAREVWDNETVSPRDSPPMRPKKKQWTPWDKGNTKRAKGPSALASRPELARFIEGEDSTAFGLQSTANNLRPPADADDVVSDAGSSTVSSCISVASPGSDLSAVSDEKPFDEPISPIRLASESFEVMDKLFVQKSFVEESRILMDRASELAMRPELARVVADDESVGFEFHEEVQGDWWACAFG